MGNTLSPCYDCARDCHGEELVSELSAFQGLKDSAFQDNRIKDSSEFSFGQVGRSEILQYNQNFKLCEKRLYPLTIQIEEAQSSDRIEENSQIIARNLAENFKVIDRQVYRHPLRYKN